MNLRLPELRHSDLCRLSHFVAELNSCKDFEELESFFHSSIRSLVGGDVSVWNEVTTDNQVCYGSTWPRFDDRFWNQIAPVLIENLQQHPLLNQLRKEQPSRFAEKSTGLMGHAEFLNTTLYNDAYREWDCRYMCYSTIRTEGNGYLLFQINRSYNDFSERDVQLFQALTLFTQPAFERLKEIERLRISVGRGAADTHSDRQFWMNLGAYLNVQNASRNARLTLDRRFPDGISGFKLPSLITSKVEPIISQWAIDNVPEKFRFRRFEIFDEMRHMQFQFHQVNPFKYRLIGIDLDSDYIDSSGILSSTALDNSSNLNLEELKILGWICKGKTNPEIAIIRSKSTKSVERHVSSIFDKLEASSRTELIRRYG